MYEVISNVSNAVYYSVAVKSATGCYRVSARKGTSEDGVATPWEVIVFKCNEKNEVAEDDWRGLLFERFKDSEEATSRAVDILNRIDEIVEECKPKSLFE